MLVGASAGSGAVLAHTVWVGGRFAFRGGRVARGSFSDARRGRRSAVDHRPNVPTLRRSPVPAGPLLQLQPSPSPLPINF